MMTKRRKLRFALCVTAVAVLAGAFACGCASTAISPLARVAARKGKSFIIAESKQGHGWGVLSHARIIQLSESNLMLRYYVGGDSMSQDEVDGRDLSGVSPAITADAGKTWKFGEKSIDPRLAAASKYWGFDVPTAQGTVIGAPGGKDCVLVCGETVIEGPWDAMIKQIEGEVSFTPYQRGAVMPNGDLVAVAQNWYQRTKTDRKLKVGFLRSSDRGKTWTVESIVADATSVPWAEEWPGGFEGPNEPSIAVLRNGEIICVARVGIKKTSVWESGERPAINMLLSRSADGGQTWIHRRLNLGGVFPKLTLMKNGVLALAFGRPGNRIMFSADGGRTWGAEMELTMPDARTSGYCDIVEVGPSRLFAVHDGYNTDFSGVWLWEPKEVNGIFGSYVNVNRLFSGRN